MAANDRRLTFRLSAELDEWLGAEGQNLGLDKGAFARLILSQARNGRGLTVAPAQLATHPTTPPWEELPAEPPQLTESTTPISELEPHPEVNLDDLVSDAIESAPVAPLPPNQEDMIYRESGVRAISRPVSKLHGSLPSWIGGR